MWPNLHETADLVTFTEEILNEKLHFLWNACCYYYSNNNTLFSDNLITQTNKIKVYASH